MEISYAQMMRAEDVRTLKQEGSINTCSLSGVWLRDRCAVGSGVDGTVLGVENVGRWHIW